VTTIRIAMALAIALFGVLVISTVAVASEAYASGGLMSLVAHGAQDAHPPHGAQTSDDALGSIVPGLDNDTNQH
jgi:hypothetical protein